MINLQKDDKAHLVVSFEEPDYNLLSKSSVACDDSKIYDVNLFLYRNGRLEWSLYRETGSDISIEVIRGETYSVYACANVGELAAPDNENDILSLVYEFSDLGNMEKSGVPMGITSRMSIRAEDQYNSLNVRLERLVSRFDFTLDCSRLAFGSFRLTSARLCQVSSTVKLFKSGSCAKDQNDLISGDYASSQDISLLNNNGKISLYLPENMQGRLLPGNTDPWAKDYYNGAIEDKKKLCTYLEVKGTYSDNSDAYAADNIYRMYLGDDATTDFNIARNTAYTLTLSVSDLGVYRDSWKVERCNVSDRRSIFFSPSCIDLYSLDSVSVDLNVNPSNADYHLEWDKKAFSDAFLSSPAENDGSVEIISTAEVSEDDVVYLKAVTFDNQVAGMCTIHVKPALLLDFDFRWTTDVPEYVAQSGNICFSGMAAGAVMNVSSSNPNVVRVIYKDGNARVENIREGKSNISFSLQAGGKICSKDLELNVSPVFLSTKSDSYRAYADGGANAVSVKNADEWELSYDIPRSEFDPVLYAELLKPVAQVFTSVGNENNNFKVNEDTLTVSGWNGDVGNVIGKYRMRISPKGMIYSDSQKYIEKSVVVEAPVQCSALTFEGDNMYYMPDPGKGVTLTSTESSKFCVGNPKNLKLCITNISDGYGEGLGFINPSLQLPKSGENEGLLVLNPSYDDIVASGRSLRDFKGTGYKVIAMVRNELSGETSDAVIGTSEIFLDFAVSTRLYRWNAADECDEDGDFFIVPYLYSERFDKGLVTFYEKEAGASGDAPYLIPERLICNTPSYYDLGNKITMSENLPMNTGSTYSEFQLSDVNMGKKCLSLSKAAYYYMDYGGNLFDSEKYCNLRDSTDGWFHKKTVLNLYDPYKKVQVPDGGYVDLLSWNGYDYHLRIVDYAKTIPDDWFD